MLSENEKLMQKQLREVQKTMSPPEYREWIISSIRAKDVSAEQTVKTIAQKCSLHGKEFFSYLEKEWIRLTKPRFAEKQTLMLHDLEVFVLAENGKYVCCTGYNWTSAPEHKMIAGIPKADFVVGLRDAAGRMLYAPIQEEELVNLLYVKDSRMISQLKETNSESFNQNMLACLMAEKLLRVQTRDRKVCRMQDTEGGAIYEARQTPIKQNQRGLTVLWTKEFRYEEDIV